MVTRLDRLARSTRDLLNTLAAITEKKAGFRSLGAGRVRARPDPHPHRRRPRAKARGVKLGRKPKLTSHQQREAIRRRDVDGETLADIARNYNVSRSTISRLTG
jgi:DNA invertase Pin-like site-specific DNA recombinase